VAFSDEEIERQRRAFTSRKRNVDYDALRAKHDLIYAARTDTPEEFQARMTGRGIDMASEE
jgi:hypothetical protein